MTARTFSFWYGPGRHALLYDLATTIIAYPPGGPEELEDLYSQMWRLAYPLEVVHECRQR